MGLGPRNGFGFRPRGNAVEVEATAMDGGDVVEEEDEESVKFKEKI